MKVLVTITFLFSVLTSIFAEKVHSPFNGKIVESIDSNRYQFIVSGHFHGSGTNKTGYPTNTILANLDWVNESEAAFIICLGDLFLNVSHDIPFYQKSFFSKLEIPLLNAVGNHDLMDDIYESNFGKTFYSYQLRNDLHIVFDSELNDGSLKNEQLEMLKKSLKSVKTGKIKNVFIYSHRTVWVKHFSELNNLFKGNTQSILSNNFSKEIFPILEEMTSSASVFWFSGSMGEAPASFFYFKDQSNITFIATAIRGLKRDAVLNVTVIDDVPVFDLHTFTGENLMNLEDYNVAYWDTHSGGEEFNYRLIPYYAKIILLHWLFWVGVVTTSILFGIFILISRKRRRNKTLV